MPAVTSVLTVFGGKHCDHGAERPLSHGVVDPYFHLVAGQGCDTVVPVHIAGGIGRGQHGLGPRAGAQRPERHDVAQVLAALQLFWDGLG